MRIIATTKGREIEYYVEDSTIKRNIYKLINSGVVKLDPVKNTVCFDDLIDRYFDYGLSIDTVNDKY